MATFYVSTAGNNAWDGTQPAFVSGTTGPKRNIINGINLLGSGDTLQIRGGTYTEQIVLNTYAGSNMTTGILTIESFPGETAIVQTPAGLGGHCVDLVNCSFIQFVDLIFDGVFIEGVGILCTASGTNHHIRFSGCELKNVGASHGGMADESTPTNTNGVNQDGADHEWINCHFHDIGNGAYDHCMYFSGARTLIEGCHIHHVSGHGLHKYPEGDDSIIRNNVIHHCGQSGFLGNPIATGGPGIGLYTGSGTVVYNNFCYSNWEAGITSSLGEDDSWIYHNTCWDNSYTTSGSGHTGGINNEDGGLGMVAWNNISYDNNGWPALDGTWNTLNLNDNLLDVDPSFVSEAGANLHLMPGSAAVDGASPITTPFAITTDFDGDTRVFDPAADIGADEIAPGSATEDRSSWASQGTGTAVSVEAPADVVDGDLIIIAIHSDLDTTHTDNNGARPFTQDLIDTSSPVNQTVSIWHRRMQAGDAAAFASSGYNFTTGGSPAPWTIIAVAFENPNPSLLYDVEPIANHSTGVAFSGSANSITTVTSGAIHCIVMCPYDTPQTINSFPAGYEVLENEGTMATCFAIKTIVDAGPTNPQTFGWTSDDVFIAVNFAIRNVSPDLTIMFGVGGGG